MDGEGARFFAENFMGDLLIAVAFASFTCLSLPRNQNSLLRAVVDDIGVDYTDAKAATIHTVLRARRLFYVG